MRVRALTVNLFAQHGDWPVRRQALRQALRVVQPDVVALQEAVVDDAYDEALDVLGPDFAVAHQRVGLVGDGRHRGASIASRWPIRHVHEVDLHVTPRTWDYSCGTLIAEIEAPQPVGRLLVASHGNSWARGAEHERELQAVAVVQRIEQLVAEHPAHVIIGGDFNATPDSAGMRFFTGRQSLGGVSTAYRDCWEAAHPGESGATFDPDNPLTRIDEPELDGGRRIDYLLVRCGDHGPTLRVTDCTLALNQPSAGSMPSDHYAVLADLELPQ